MRTQQWLPLATQLLPMLPAINTALEGGSDPSAPRIPVSTLQAES